MITYKLNVKFLIFLIILILVLIMVGRVTYMWINDETTDEGDALEIMMPLILLISLSWLWSVIVMLRQYIVHKGRAFTLTEAGIENTLIVTIVFALIFVLPVKWIPWEAVTYSDGEEKYIRVKRKYIRAGFLAKTFVALLGYQFCLGFTKPKMTRQDYETWIKPRLPEKTLHAGEE